MKHEHIGIALSAMGATSQLGVRSRSADARPLVKPSPFGPRRQNVARPYRHTTAVDQAAAAEIPDPARSFPCLTNLE